MSRQHVGRQADLGVIDLPPAVPGFAMMPRVNDCKQRDQGERQLGKSGRHTDTATASSQEAAPVNPRPNSDHNAMVAMGVDHGLGNLGDRRLGQSPHRGGAGNIGRYADDAAYDKKDEAAALHAVVVREECDNKEVIANTNPTVGTWFKII